MNVPNFVVNRNIILGRDQWYNLFSSSDFGKTWNIISGGIMHFSHAKNGQKYGMTSKFNTYYGTLPGALFISYFVVLNAFYFAVHKKVKMRLPFVRWA